MLITWFLSLGMFINVKESMEKWICIKELPLLIISVEGKEDPS